MPSVPEDPFLADKKAPEDPHDGVFEDTPRKTWWGLGSSGQITLGRVVNNPGCTAESTDFGINMLVSRGLIYERKTSDLGVIYFATLRGQQAYREGTYREEGAS